LRFDKTAYKKGKFIPDEKAKEEEVADAVPATKKVIWMEPIQRTVKLLA
jgi:hypothetical protein